MSIGTVRKDRNMALTDRIQKDIGKKTINSEELINDMQGAAAALIQQAMTKIKNGQMEINDPNDLSRVWAIIEKTTNYNEILENVDKSAEGTLPEVSTKEAKILGVSNNESDDIDSLEDINETGLSGANIDDMISNLAENMNKDNVIAMDKKREEEG